MINIPEDAPVTQTVEVVTTPTVAQPINLTIEEVLVVEMDMEDSNSAGRHQATLARVQGDRGAARHLPR